MAEQKPLKAGGTGPEKFGATDTFPATALPARLQISPTQITSDQDDYAPTGWDTAQVVRLDFDTGGRAIRGFAAWSGPQKTIINTSGNFGYIPCEHPASTAANRVTGQCDHIIAPYGTLLLEYDDTSDRVRVVGNSYNPAAPGIGILRAHFYALSVGSVTAADWGDFAFAVTGTGAAVATTAATAANPAGWSLSTGTTTTGACSIYFSKNILNPTYFSSAHIIASCLIMVTTLSDGTNTYTLSFGLVPSPSSVVLNVNNSVTIQYTHGVNSGKSLGVSRDNAGGQSTVDLGVTVAAGTPYLLTVCHNKANGETRFYVDGVFAGRVTGNMPNAVAVGARAHIIKSAGATARLSTLSTLLLTTVY